ncbi:MFS transporter [Nocardiopsis sp. NPDC101807]|uniref:MFS transporter n=1 Tax=Nocardiopsis sp. NPDC101807 TaxID=3364339 RepID=UPI0038169C5B
MTETAPLSDPPPTTGPRRLGGRFWTVWTSSGLSNLADGILKIALPLAALRFTDSPTLIAGVAFALTIPWLLLSLPAGALADRYDRRRLMVGADLARGLLLAGLAAALALDLGSVWLLYAVALGVGTAETLHDTSAQSILPQVVGRDRLSRANGRLYAVELTAHQFAGPPLGGLLVALGVAAAFAAPAALWLVAAGALVLVRGSFRIERAAPTAMRTDIAEGLRFLWRHRTLRTLAAMVGLSNFSSNAAFTVMVLFAVGPDSPMGLSEPAYGLLLTAAAAGSVLGALTAEHVERLLGRAWSLRVCALAFAVLVGVPALTADPLAVGAGFFVGGVGLSVWNVVTVSLRQRVTPDHLLGRLNSAYRLLAWGTLPLGAAAGGLIAQFFGLTAVFAGMGALALALFLWQFALSETDLGGAGRATAVT